MRARLAGLALLALGSAACGDAARVSLTPSTVAESGASNPTVAMTDDGAALIAWVGGDSSENVWLVRADSGAPGAPVRVNDRDGDAAAHAQAPAQVATGPDGSVYVVWQNNTVIEGRRFPSSDLRFARSADGGRTFDPAIYVNDDAGGAPSSHTFHDVAVGADGSVYVSWIDGRRDDEAGPDIRVARSADGGRTFGASTVVAAASCPCCRTSLAVAADGTVFVAWRHVFAGGIRDIALARSTDRGITFEPPVRVHDDGWVFDGCPHAGPSVAVAPDGTVHVAWYTGAPDASGVYHATSADGGRTFGPRRALTESGHVPTSQVALAADAGGAVWAAWEAVGETGPRIRLGRVDGDAPPRITDVDAPPGLLPALAVEDGAIALAWLDGESARALIGSAATR